MEEDRGFPASAMQVQALSEMGAYVLKKRDNGTVMCAIGVEGSWGRICLARHQTTFS